MDVSEGSYRQSAHNGATGIAMEMPPGFEIVDNLDLEDDDELDEGCQINPDCFLGDGHPGECATE